MFVGPATLAVFAPIACSDDPAPATTTTTPDGSTTPPDGGATPTDEAGPTPGQDGGSCSPVVNGSVNAKSGSLSYQIKNPVGANVIAPSTGTLDCEGSFDPNSGVSFGNNTYSGAFGITCWAALNDEYYGLVITGPGVPKTATQFKVGKGSGVPLGDGGYAANGQCDVAWEEGPRCDTKQDKSKSWNGEKELGQGGILYFDEVNGPDAKFHLVPTGMTVSTNGLNYKGTGSFSVDVLGTVKLIGL